MRRSSSSAPRRGFAHGNDNPYVQEARRLRLKKHFSQHFLVNGQVLQRIASLMQLDAADTILEIGPGAGFLTEQLLISPAQQVIAVELERDMLAHLTRKLGSHPRFQLHADDILRFDFNTLEAPRFKVVGNLPYAITSKIMFRLCGELGAAQHPLRSRIQQLTVMVQKEVGERITATPGSKAYNAMSVALQFWFETRYDFTVPAHDFLPPPKVESAVVSLFPRPQPAVQVHDLARFDQLVRTGFAQKRKTIRNALLNGGFASGAVLDRIFEQAGVDSGLRAEALSIQAFGDLSNALGTDPGKS